MIKKSNLKRNIQKVEFTATIRQARLNESHRESSVRFPENDEKAQFRKFIRERFHSIECRHFTLNEATFDEGDSKCKCGEKRKNHKIDKIPFCQSNSWDETDSIEYLATDTFGKIEFTGEDITNTKLTDFVRVGYKDKLDDVLDLLFNKWNINIGALCISVIGGSANFKMPRKEKNIFCQGLIKATITTNALIITLGLNTGITSIIGDAIQYSQSYLYDKMKHNNFIRCLGITPWGYVKSRHILEFAKGRTVQYNETNEFEISEPISLNRNHTHYLFYDDGYRLQGPRDKIRFFRRALESRLSQKQGCKEAISMVLLVVEGGHEIFLEIIERIRNNVSILICEGTGRASNILGEAVRKASRICEKKKIDQSDGVRIFSEMYKISLRKKLIEQNVSELHQVNEAVDCIEEIVRYRNLITLFDIKSNEDLDFAILYSLIKRFDVMCNAHENGLSCQVSLCLAWNRVDIIKHKIFTGDIFLTNDEWVLFFKESIVKGRLEFIELFLQNVSNIRDIFSKNILQELYETYPKSRNFLKTFLRLIGRPFSKGLDDVDQLLSKMIGYNKTSSILKYDYLQNPFQELFVWAILMEKHKCAKFFWDKCDDALFLALLATRIYKCHQRTSIRDTDRQENLKIWKDYFENLAVKLLEECSDFDQEAAWYLVEKENPVWSGITCLELAYKSKNLKFMSSVVCQNSIEFSWKGGFNINFLECILCIIFPCLLLKQNEYTKDYKAHKSHHIHDFSVSKLNNSSSFSSLKRFYLAPQTKFCIHSITYLIFVAYFSFTVLYGMKRMQLTIHEIIFMVYLIMMILDKIIEIFETKREKLIARLKYWWKINYWNKVDMIIIILSIIAMLLRIFLIVNTWNFLKVIIFRYSKTIYSVIVGIFYLKFLRLLTRHRNLGPKMVMMIELVKQLLIYLIIIIIFLMSYGVASQAGYYPQRDFSWIGLSNIFDYPCWTMLGFVLSSKNVYLPWCNSSTSYDDANECPERNFVIPIFFAAYLTISNILIINILVATNSYVCEDIHKDSLDIWRYNKYSILSEYEKKPIFPLPFSIFIHAYNLFRKFTRESGIHFPKINIFLNVSENRISKSATMKMFSDIKSSLELDKLVKYFENLSQKSIIKDMSTKTQKSLESRMTNMESKLNIILDNMDKIHLNWDIFITKNVMKNSTRDEATKIRLQQNKVTTKYILSNVNDNILSLQNEVKNYKHTGIKRMMLETVNKIQESQDIHSIDKSSDSIYLLKEFLKSKFNKELKNKNIEKFQNLNQRFAEIKSQAMQSIDRIGSLIK